MHDQLIQSFLNYWPLDERAINALKSKATYQTLKKKAFLLKEGQECNHFTFVVKGCLKLYHIDKQGNQHNLQFAVENNWLADYGSFYAEEPSDLNIQALEPSDVLQIEKDDLFDLYDNFPVFDRNFRIIIENAFIEQQKRLLQSISSTAEQRYLYFLKKYPDLYNRISNVQIASYIGVTPEFLSTIRKRIAVSKT